MGRIEKTLDTPKKLKLISIFNIIDRKMKDVFPEYNIPTKNEFKKMWNKAIFVFDTNVLLDMYRYSEDTRKTYLKVLQDLKAEDKLWIPYHIGEEFFKKRLDVIFQYKDSYQEIIKHIQNAKRDIKTSFKDHPIINLESIEKSLDNIIKDIEKAEKKHPDWLEEDGILPQINKIFKNCVSSPLPGSELKEIEKEGEKRYEKKIPPGYCDHDKEENKYGDLIIWKSLIKKAKKSKRPIIFITKEKKEDWWKEKEGKTIMPRPELRREMLEETGSNFYLYTSDRFLERFENIEEKDFTKIKKETIEEVKKIQLQDKATSRKLDFLLNFSFYNSELNLFLLELFQKFTDLKKLNYLSTKDVQKLQHFNNFLRNLRNRNMHEKISQTEIKELFYSIRELKLFVHEIKSRYNNEPEILEDLNELYSLLNKGSVLTREFLFETDPHFYPRKRTIHY